MTASYKNPNKALRRKPKPHPVRTAIRRGVTVFLALLVTFTLFLTLCIAGVRGTITPEFVYRFTENISYADLPLPTGDGFITVADLLEEGFQSMGLPLSHEDILTLFEQFSIPTVVAGVAQDCVTWLLHDGPRPVLNPYEISILVLSGLDESIVQILQMFGSPETLFAEALAPRLASIRMNALLDTLEPARRLLSVDTFALLSSGTMLLAVLLFCICLCQVRRVILPLGFSSFGAGVYLLFTALALPLSIPRITMVYGELLTDFFSPLCGGWCRYALALFFIGILLAGCGILVKLIERKKRRIPDRIMTTPTELSH